MSFYNVSATAASNTTINSISAAGSASANLIDDLIRQLAAQDRQFANDLGGNNTVGGTADAITITPSSGSITAAFSGLLIGFVAAYDNATTTPTANVGGLGAEPIKKTINGAETSLVARDIQAGSFYWLLWRPSWDGSNGAWELISAGFASSQSNRNRIINGRMQIAQRGTSFSGGTDNADDAYTLDRWYILSEGSDSIDVTQSTEHPETGGKSIALDVETTGEKFGIAQIIEGANCVGLIGNEVTLSFAAKVSNARIDTIKCGIVAWSGTVDSVTSDIVSSWGADGTTPTLIANATFENTPADLGVTTSWATYSVTATIDTSNTTNVIVFIWSDDATNPQAGDILYVTDVQIEPGPVATTFENKPVSAELADCQRYCQKNTYFLSMINEAASTRTFVMTYSLPVPMRVTPTVISSGYTNVSSTSNGSVIAYSTEMVRGTLTASAGLATCQAQFVPLLSAEL